MILNRLLLFNIYSIINALSNPTLNPTSITKDYYAFVDGNSDNVEVTKFLKGQ
jgi:hypothetical protein